MSRFAKRTLAIALIVILILAAGLFTLWAGLFDISKPVRAIVIRQMEKVTGRDVSLGDELEFAVSLAPTLIATDVAIANMPSGSVDHMLAAETLSIQLQLLPLMRHEIVIDSLALSGATVVLERDAEGRQNWQLEAAPDASEREPDVRRTPPFLAEISLTNTRLIWIDATSEHRERIDLDTLSWDAADPESPLSLQVRGRWKQKPIEISGQLGAIATLLDGEGRWPVNLNGRFGGNEIEIDGEIGVERQDTNLAIDLKGESTRALANLFGISFPSIGGFSVSGAVRGPIAAPALENLSGTLGSIETGALRISNGRIADLFTFAEFRVPLSLETSSSANFAKLWNITAPSMGKLSGDGILRRTNGGPIAISSLDMVVGDAKQRLRINGAVGALSEKPHLDLTLEASLKKIPEGVRAAYASLVPVSGQARLTGPFDRLNIPDLTVTSAGMTVHGRLHIAPIASPPAFTGSLSTDELDLQTLAGLRPQPGTNAQSDGDGGSVDLGVLRAVSLDLDLKVSRIVSNEFSLGSATARLKLKNGDLTLRDIDIRVLGGKVDNAHISIDTRQAHGAKGPRAAMGLRLRAEDLDLGALLKQAGTVPASNLEIDVDLTAESAGKTATELLSDLEGSGHIISDGGRVLETKLDQLVQDLDPIRLLLPLWRRADVVNVNCLVADIDLDQGIGNTELMFDTGKMTVLGKGIVDLRKEQLNFTLKPKPKSKALSATGVPVELSGDLTSPEVIARPRDAVPSLFKGLVGGLLVPLNQVARIFGREARDACAQALQQP